MWLVRTLIAWGCLYAVVAALLDIWLLLVAAGVCGGLAFALAGAMAMSRGGM